MASTWAIEPPPAPISTISITGMRTGSPDPFRKRAARSTSNTREVSGWYFSIRQIFAVVPPMSKDQDPALTETRGDLRRKNRAACRPRFDQAHRKAPRRLDRGDAATRGHQINGAAKLLGLQPLGHAREIAVDQRLHIGIGHRSRGPLVFTDFRAYRRRQRDPDARYFLFEDRAGAPFMLGIGIGVEEGEGDAFHILRAQLRHECTHGGFVERQPHGALRIDALGDRKTQGARRQRFRLVDRKVVLIVAALGTDIEHVAKTLRCDERRLRAAAFDDGVGRKRGAVNEDVDIAYVGARIGQNETHPVQHGLLRSRGRRQYFACSAILAHIQDDIRERASDVDGKPHFGSFKHSKSPRADRRTVDKCSAISMPLTAPTETCPAILPGAYAAQLRRTRAAW